MRLGILKGFVKNYWGAPTPLVLCHQITLRCNLRCSFCPFWRRAASVDEDELSTEEIKSVLSQAAGLGVAVYNVWGGEPLLRADLAECLAHAKNLGLATHVITNGILLESRTDELAPYIDYLSVSIDGLRKAYAALRGCDAFDKVIRGIEACRNHKIKTAINCVVCNKNLDELKELVALAESFGVGISFEPVHEFEDIPSEDWEGIGIRDGEKYEKAIDGLIALKKEGRKVVNSFAYLELMKRLKPDFDCVVHKILLHIDAVGNVTTCFGSLGSTRDRSLKEIWFSAAAKSAREKMETCDGCLFSGYAETSLLYSLNLGSLLNTARIL